MMPNVKLLFAFLLLLMFIACMNTSVQLSPKAGEIDALFNALEKDNAFNGAVLVAKKGKVIYKKAFGLGNFEKGERLTVQSVFEIASVSKTFTAVAVHQLVERGALRLDDPLTKFFPKLPYDGVTIRGLLSHTSGLFDVSGIEDLRKQFFAFYNRTEPPYTNKDYLEFLEKFTPPLIGKPGEKFQYSNTGYVLLGVDCRTSIRTKL